MVSTTASANAWPASAVMHVDALLNTGPRVNVLLTPASSLFECAYVSLSMPSGTLHTGGGGSAVAEMNGYGKRGKRE